MKSRIVESPESSSEGESRSFPLKLHRSEKAVALQYLEEQSSPRVLAAGRGELAELIVQIAEKNNIPVLKDASLTEILSRLQVGEVLSSQCYEVIAEIVGFLYELESDLQSLPPGQESN